MAQTSVRKSVAGESGLAGLSRDERIATLRAQLAAVHPAGDVKISAQQVDDCDIIPVPPALAEVLPGGGLRRRQAVELGLAAGLAVELIAHISGNGGMVAVVGWPELGYIGVPAAGGDLTQIVVIPDAGVDGLEVVAALVEGVDAVFYRNPVEAYLPASRTRKLMAKLRTGRAALLTVGVRLETSAPLITADITGYRGIGAGVGRIQAVDMRISATVHGRKRMSTMTIGRSRELKAV